MPRRLRVEPAGAVLDGIGAVERQRLAWAQLYALQRLRREALDRVTIDAGDVHAARLACRPYAVTGRAGLRVTHIGPRRAFMPPTRHTICGSEALAADAVRVCCRANCLSFEKAAGSAPVGRGCRAEEGPHEFRQVYRPRQGLRAGGAEPRLARRPPAVRHRSPAQGPARRSRGDGGRPHPARRRAPGRCAGRRRAHAQQAAQGFGRRRWASLSCARPGASVQFGREARRQSRRQVRHRRALAAGAGHGALERSRARAQRGGRQSHHAEPGHQRHPQGPHRRQRRCRAGLRCAEALLPAISPR